MLSDITGDTVVLFDFGGTLGDESWMLRDPGGCPGWGTAYQDVLTAQVATEWWTGGLTTHDVAERVAFKLDAPVEVVSGYIRKLFLGIDLFPGIVGAARRRRSRGGKQALVSVNPIELEDVLSDRSLLDTFDTVVLSATEGNDNKLQLCEIALRRMGAGPDQSLLIDNVRTNVDAFERIGGSGYLFSDDHRFLQDVSSGLLLGFEPADADVAGIARRITGARWHA